jgi:hypothetical protein
MTAPVTVRFEMGCVPAEFHRLLPLVAPVTFDAARREFTHTAPDRIWRLRILAERERRIALVRLPVVDVELVFEGYAPADVDAVIARFWSYFRRGGG